MFKFWLEGDFFDTNYLKNHYYSGELKGCVLFRHYDEEKKTDVASEVYYIKYHSKLYHLFFVKEVDMITGIPNNQIYGCEVPHFIYFDKTKFDGLIYMIPETSTQLTFQNETKNYIRYDNLSVPRYALLEIEPYPKIICSAPFKMVKQDEFEKNLMSIDDIIKNYSDLNFHKDAKINKYLKQMSNDEYSK